MARTLFNSSEKSNFILNMTEEQYSKLASYGLVGACVLVPLFTIIPECLSTATYTFASGGLVVAGVFCMIMAFIALIKKYIKGGTLFPVLAFAAMLVWSVVSAFDSFDYAVGFYGYPQRGEGVMAIMFYCSVFVSAASIKNESAVNTLLKGIMAAGLINSLWALIQVFASKLSHYIMISLEIRSQSASGLAQSPLFFAAFMSLALTAVLISAIKGSSTKEKVICGILAGLFAFVMMFTYTFIALCGIAVSVIIAAVSVFAMKASRKTLIIPVIPAVAAALAVLLVCSGNIGNLKTYKLYDGRQLWWADAYMRAGASGDFNSDVLDIENTKDVYLYLNQKSMDIASRYPLTGTGPDQLVYPQLYTFGILNEEAEMTDVIIQNRGTFDRVYNEYIYTAATRGYPSLIAMLAVIIPALYISFKAMKKRRSGESTAVFMLTLCGALIFFVSCGNINYSPVYWAVAGLACASLSKQKTETSKAEKIKKK